MVASRPFSDPRWMLASALAAGSLFTAVAGARLGAARLTDLDSDILGQRRDFSRMPSR
jgi:hypothetical protein